MKLKNYIAGLLLTGALVASKTTFAQQNSLAGSWVLQEKTHLTGTDYGNAVDESLTIANTGKQWSITRVNNGTTITENLPEGASPSVSVTPDDRQKTLKVTWNGDHGFTEDKSYSAPGDHAKAGNKVHEEYALSADGKTLTITRSFENTQDADDKWSAKGEYTRK